jgi:hypothetical protein
MLLGLSPVEVLPVTASASSTVRWLCCINKGRVDMRGTLPKNCYVAGEEAMVSRWHWHWQCGAQRLVLLFLRRLP